MGCPLSCPAKAIPHWWGPRRCKSTLVAALLRSAAPTREARADPRPAAWARWGSCPVPCALRSLRAPGPALKGSFRSRGGVRGFGLTPPGPTLALGVVAERPAARRCAAPWCVTGCGVWEIGLLSELSGGQLSGCCVPSVWAASSVAGAREAEAGLDAPPAAQVSAAVFAGSFVSGRGWTVLQMCPPRSGHGATQLQIRTFCV